MPFTPEHKARTRTRIVAGARVLFNRKGFDQVSIDEIMQAAGLTRGGFYNHFSSAHPGPKQAARRLVELYLSDAVLNDVDQHCPIIAVPSDVARVGLEPRSAYTSIVRRMLELFQAAFPPSDRRATVKAHLILNLCVGGMLIARTTDDRELRQSLRAAALDEALRLLATGEHRDGRSHQQRPRSNVRMKRSA